METLQIDEFPCETIPLDNGAVTCKMSLPEIPPEDLPTVSIVTPTHNRKLFTSLMLRNWETIDYPRNKLEWIIVDDGTETLEIPKDPQIRYIQLKEKILLGKKRNFLASLAKHEYIVHMDDDDFYPPESVVARVKALLISKDKYCTGCTSTLCYDLIHDQTFEAYDASVDDLPATISESSMAYTKEFWKQQRYKDTDTQAECLNFIKNRHNQIITIPYIFVVTQFSHAKNTIQRWMSQNTKHTVQFTTSLSMRDSYLVNDLRARILMTFPTWKKAIEFINKNQKLPYKQFLRKMEKSTVKENPLVLNMFKRFKTKINSSGKDLVYYCGPGNHFQFTNPWNPHSKNLGGSEEAVINISEILVQKGWNVTVYCVTDNPCTFNGVKYKHYWEWLPLNKQDVTVIWRDPSIADENTINSTVTILDVHDVLDQSWMTDNVTYTFVKSEFHKKILDTNAMVIPNGIHTNKFKNSSKTKNIIINTSSPDRGVRALLKALPIIRKEIPDAEVHWAYGFKSGIGKGGMEADYREHVRNWVEETKQLIKETKGFHDLGRLSQDEVIDLYKKGKVFAYSTRFPEIDCISMTKAIAAGCTPVVTNSGAMGNKLELLGINKTFVKSNLTDAIDYSLCEGPAFDEWIQDIIYSLKNPQTYKLKEYDWNNIVEKWLSYITPLING